VKACTIRSRQAWSPVGGFLYGRVVCRSSHGDSSWRELPRVRRLRTRWRGISATRNGQQVSVDPGAVRHPAVQPVHRDVRRPGVPSDERTDGHARRLARHGPITAPMALGAAIRHRAATMRRASSRDRRGVRPSARRFRTFPGRVHQPARAQHHDRAGPTWRRSAISSCRSPYPPNPNQPLDGGLTADQDAGRRLFETLRVSPNPGLPGRLVRPDVLRHLPCERCRSAIQVRRPPGFFRPPPGLSSFDFKPQLLKIPHLRNLYIRRSACSGMHPILPSSPGDNDCTGDQVRGFGFSHDGRI